MGACQSVETFKHVTEKDVTYSYNHITKCIRTLDWSNFKRSKIECCASELIAVYDGCLYMYASTPQINVYEMNGTLVRTLTHPTMILALLIKVDNNKIYFLQVTNYLFIVTRMEVCYIFRSSCLLEIL